MNRWGRLIACVVLGLLSCVLFSTVSYASHPYPLNDFERFIVDENSFPDLLNTSGAINYSCHHDIGQHIGMLWLTSQYGNAYADLITIQDENPMTVYITGTVYNCGTGAPMPNPDMTDIEEEYNNVWKKHLLSIDYTSCFRGDPGNENHVFSDSQCFIPATLDSKSVIQFCSDSGQGEYCKVWIYIYRCFDHSHCRISMIPVKVKIPNWKIGVQADVSQRTATPGDIVTFTYTGTQNGPARLDRTVNFYYNTDGVGGGHAVWSAGKWRGYSQTWTVQRRITQNDVGRRVCGTLTVDPSEKMNPVPKTSNPACVEVPYNWHSRLATEGKIDSNYVNVSTNYNTSTHNAYPTDRLTWHHRADFFGPTKAQNDVSFISHNSLWGHGSDIIGRQNAYWGQGDGAYGSANVFNYEGARGQGGNPYTVMQDDVSHNICENFSAQPGQGYGMSPSPYQQNFSNRVCMHIPYHYTVEPPDPNSCIMRGNCPSGHIMSGNEAGAIPTANNTSGRDYALIGDDISFRYMMRHAGGRTKTMPIELRGYAVLLKGDYAARINKDGPVVINGREFNSVECSSRAPRNIDKRSIKRCIRTTIQPNNVVYPGQGAKGAISYDYKTNLNDEWLRNAAEPGDKICVYAALNKWQAIDDQLANSIVASNLACIDVAKQPQIKIIGGDAFAQGRIHTATLFDGNALNYDRGSWSQYALMANGSIDGMGSGGFTASTIHHRSLASLLDYANRDKLGLFSRINHQPSMPPSLDRLQQRYTVVNTLPTNLAPGQHLVYVSDGDVTIDHNIIYGNNVNASFKNIYDIPSLTVIAAGNINISANVSHLDGVFVSKKRITTCAEAIGRSLSTNSETSVSGSCNRSTLTVRGALVSQNSARFYRVYGSEHAPGRITPAGEEVIYTPNTFLTPTLLSRGDDNDDTDYVTTQANFSAARY